MNRKLAMLLATVVTSLSFAGTSQALVLYTNNAGTPYVQSFNPADGTMLNSFTGSGSNGRGVVTVGNIVYTTDANSGYVGKFDRTTGLNLGGFTIAGVTGISTISFDGDNFWTSDYTGLNKAYYVSPTGEVLKTITLSESGANYDGLEYFDNKLIANELDSGYGAGDGNRYSIYDTDGNLLTKDFIDTNGHGNGTGIAYDGTNFYISDILNGRATIWSGGDGSYLGSLDLIGTANLIEDLSFDFGKRIDTCRVNCDDIKNVPEPASLALIGIGLLGLIATRRGKRS